MIPVFLDKSVLPHKPGVYIYRDEDGKVIYVGKAIDLYHRVSSYFSGEQSLKTAALVERIRSVETVIVESELEALILEANLIKKYTPLYNISLKDDKDYLYIAITKEEFPKVITAKKKHLQPIKAWFGPYPSSRTVKETLKKIRRVFPWCSNPHSPRDKFSRPCFYYHLKLCPGACLGVITKEEYNKIISRFKKFLEGRKDELLEELTGEMIQKAESQQFEQAQKLKSVIEGIQYITQTSRVGSYLENPNFLEDERQKGLAELQKHLNLQKIPGRIEGYDISNTQGKESTGSMVVLTNGDIDKSQYRKFKIHITGKPNDYAMHSEMMGRRLKHKEWPYPDLFIIDGGRGQAKAVRGIILKFGGEAATIPIYGLAKREEWLYPPEGEIIKLPKRSLALRLLQKLRDESHRFAITYHRKLRSKAFLSS